MKNVPFILITLFCVLFSSCYGPSKIQKRMSKPYFDPRSEYRKRAILRTNPSYKGVPIIESFKTNDGIGMFQIDNVADKKFICDSVWLIAMNLYNKQARSHEGQRMFETINLKSGATVIFTPDPEVRKVFISMSPGYYIAMEGCLISIFCAVDSNNTVMGSLDPYYIVNHPVEFVQYHLSSGLTTVSK